MDIAISVGLGAITLFLAYLGVHVTLHPPESRLAKTGYEVGFGVLAAFAVVLIFVQASRNAASMRKTEGSLADLKAMGHRTESSLSAFNRGPLKVEIVSPRGQSNLPRAKSSNRAPKVPVQANAPSGIAIVGGTVTNPTVFNAGLPPATLTFREERGAPADGGQQILNVHVRTDRAIPGAVIGLMFSGPVEMAPGQPSMTNAPITQFTWGPLSQGDTLVPNSLGVSVNQPAVFVPGQELTIPVRCGAGVHVLSVVTAGLK